MSRILRTHTPLGALIADRDVKVKTVVEDCEIPRARMSEYLAGKTRIRTVHLHRLADYFHVSAHMLQTPPETVKASLQQFGRTYNFSRR